MSQTISSCTNSEGKYRAKWLVFVSLILVVLLEVFPTEAGLTNISILTGSFLVWLGVKVAFLTLILLPLMIYIAINGRMGLACVKTRITIIATIIIFRLILETPCAISLLAGGQR